MGYKKAVPKLERLDKRESERNINDGCFESYRKFDSSDNVANGLPNHLHTHSPSDNVVLFAHFVPPGTARIW